MFYNSQLKEEKDNYINLLKITGALSKLSSDNDSIPYLYYRMAENIFCKAFMANNLSRSDISLDAAKSGFGIGLKTFLHKNGKPIEKIAEFNKDKSLLDTGSKYNLAVQISNLRNKRLLTTSRICGIELDNMLYHCVTKAENTFYIHESKLSMVNIEGISKNSIKEVRNVISFTDGIQEYSFNLSKSTLFQRFIINPIEIIPIKIIDEPYSILENCLTAFTGSNITNPIIETVYLPLYSYKNGFPHVFTKSGLNHWNANGRPRNADEVYITIPSIVNNKFPNFFPERDTSFTLQLPSGMSICAKVCQANRKALMSDPNATLGEWILRDVLGLEEGELLTYKTLDDLGIDSVEINKYADDTYAINVKASGTYEIFKENFL